MAQPIESGRPRVAAVAWARFQRAVRRLPMLRPLFWVPEGCVPDVPGLIALAGSRPGTLAAGLREVQLPAVEPVPGECPAGHRLFVADLAPGKVVGDGLVVATSDDVVAGGIQGLQGVNEPARHWVLRRCRYRRERRLEGSAVLLCAGAGTNYYHWLFESLPRLSLLERTGYDFEEIDYFLLNQKLQPFHSQTLDLLGIPAQKHRRCSKAEVLRCERLVIPSTPAPPMEFPPWIPEFLRNRFLPTASSLPEGQRLFVSRRHAARRRLLNEMEVETELHRAGFRTVCLEENSFVEQVALFASASVVVALHGAGLANLVFARRGTRVIEFVGPTFINHCYQKLAQAMHLGHTELVGRLAHKPRKRSEEDDVYIPLDDLRRALSETGI